VAVQITDRMDFIPEDFIAENKPEIKLLVVDDREDNLFSIETILEKDGYTIKKANSGRAALKILLKEHNFTMILMDVKMPGLNGFETATLIYERDRLKHIPIIFITANDYGEDNIFRGYQMGGVDYIYKPINPDLLRAKVAVFVELYTKNHQLLAQEQKLISANNSLEKEIQERRSSEEKINLLNSKLVENINQLKTINEELERFAYVASHDLQEPLRKITIFADRLSEKYNNLLGEQGQDYLERMVNASKRMQLLIKNLLAFSRSASSNDSFQETDLNTILSGVLTDLEVQIDQKEAKIEVSELPRLWVIPSQFRQLFQNLIINALKFSKDGCCPEISVSAEHIKGMEIEHLTPNRFNDEFCKIYIKDNGIGFEQQYADQIFTVFKRLHSFDKYEGTGIGLAICKKIVEKHNGFIQATAEVDEGSTFVITLPVRQPETIDIAVISS
jgi:signal transduction histidine kinase